jgi:4-amino-4-deoxy-L-arabinose transferase-like glycosyltransferase
MKYIQNKNISPWGALLLILALAAYFRLTNITVNPGWFTDEGTHLEVARSILSSSNSC